jgi:succinate dehydrogenase / fumarate reductase cytochrome b subunit
MTAAAIPRTFIWRRLHSLMGLWFVLFLLEHLLTNSQAALWLGDNGRGFVTMVNIIHNLPYLEVIELSLLGVPILIHMVLGVKYLFTAKSNSGRSDGSTPYIPLPRNRAYRWQRITSWILLFCLIGHVVKFRFLQYPETFQVGHEVHYGVKVDLDKGLYTVADRLGVVLYDNEAVTKQKEMLKLDQGVQDYNAKTAAQLISAQNHQEKVAFVKALEKQHLSSKEVFAVATNFGTASLLAVRNTFKNPIYIGLYTIFVLAACFHACNGFWTFLITWGWVLRMAAQRAWTTVAAAMMAVLIFLGLAAVWGTYWINLRY